MERQRIGSFRPHQIAFSLEGEKPPPTLVREEAPSRRRRSRSRARSPRREQPPASARSRSRSPRSPRHELSPQARRRANRKPAGPPELTIESLASICNLENIVGRGGFGVVKKCRRVDGQGYYAVKFVCSGSSCANSKEFTIYPTLRNEYIVNVLYKGADGDDRFLVMEYCPFSVESMIRTNREQGMAMPLKSLVSIVRSLCLGLKYIHHLGYMHRDVKPSNLLVTEEGYVKLADFGLLTTSATSWVSCGTKGYSAPEVERLWYKDLLPAQYPFRGSIGPYSQNVDVWSVGILCYECLTNRLPYVYRNKEELSIEVCNARLVPLEEHVRDPDASNFLRFVLVEDPKQRPSIDAVLDHPFLKV